jgi:hypothetical protein
MGRSDEFNNGYNGHNARCMTHAETVVREEFDKDLKAPAWDHEAVNRQNAFVTDTAKEWLDSGLKDCACN